MTKLLQQAFEAAAKLPAEDQDALAARWLAEVIEDDEFDAAISASGEKLAILSRAALEEYHDGLTEPLDPDRL